MEIAKKYDPKQVEDKWYSYWLKNGFFKSTPNNQPSHTIVIPPPNVTGVLHMGHMLNNTIQDVLIRKARMSGKNACWVPGTDHASIATEAKVVAHLKSKDIDKKNLSREAFLEHAWEWKEKHGGIILQQLKKLGASCDWDRTSFTMDPSLSESVIEVFIRLFEKGYIYRGVRMINWDPQAKTALSDEEVNYKEVDSKLYHIKYRIEGSDEHITIATTRPETILGDTAIAVNPTDERFEQFKGKRALVPLIDRSIPIIEDEYVEKDFGTGALKITPAHDINDYNLGIKHNLESIDILNDDGTLNEKATLFVGKDRFHVRKEIVKVLEEKGHIIEIKNLRNKVGFSERTNAVIEPKLSLQWFCKMEELAKPALENVLNGEIQFHPSKFMNTYKHWMENIKDWCVSRQLWWGQRIPAWYYGKGPNDFVIAKTLEEAIQKVREKTGEAVSADQIKQEEDVLDTWFSSWLWPISVFDGINEPNNEEINYYYPTQDLVTAPEIMFFWVARMIMAGYEFMGKKPFSHVYFTGIVRDKQRRKMSKSLGNSPDPIELMNKYSADGVRIGMLLSSPAGNDLLFDEQLCEQGRNFVNKVWNAFRLVHSWKTEEKPESKEEQLAIDWMNGRINKELTRIEENYGKFRISDALMQCYKLTWDDFCSWYLEMVKPGYGETISKNVWEETIRIFERILKVLHPFTPFVTEEIWQLLRERDNQGSLVISPWPNASEFDEMLLEKVEHAQEIIGKIRTFRKEKNVPFKEELSIYYNAQNDVLEENFVRMIKKIANIDIWEQVGENKSFFSFVINSNEYFIEAKDAVIDSEKEIEKLAEELKYAEGFLAAVEKKLSNANFVNNAPEQVVALEQKKKDDAINKIEMLQKQLKVLEA